jgi:hypothetical protein
MDPIQPAITGKEEQGDLTSPFLLSVARRRAAVREGKRQTMSQLGGI